MSKRIEMVVKMQVTIPQALALQAMFAHWNMLSHIGSSRKVAFFCDGDGNFHPKCEVCFSEETPQLTDKMKEVAVISNLEGNVVFDFDGIAWLLHDKLK